MRPQNPLLTLVNKCVKSELKVEKRLRGMR